MTAAPGDIRIQTHPSSDDIAAWDMRRQRLDHPILFWTRTLFPVALFMLAVVHNVLNEDAWHVVTVVASGVAATWVAVVVMPRYRQRRWAAQLGAQPSDGFLITADERGVGEDGRFQRRWIPWSAVTAIETTRGMVTIETPPSAPVMFPVRDLGGRAPKEFAAHLSTLRTGAVAAPSLDPPPNAVRIDDVDVAEQAEQISGRSLAEGAQFTRLAMAAACLVGLWLAWPWWENLLAMFWGIILGTMLVSMALQSPLASRWEKHVLKASTRKAHDADAPAFFWFDGDSAVLECAGRIDRAAISAMGAIVASPTMVTFFTAPTAAVSVPAASFESATEFERFVSDLHARKDAAKVTRAA